MVALGLGRGKQEGWLRENWVEHLIITHLLEHECGSVGLGMGSFEVIQQNEQRGATRRRIEVYDVENACLRACLTKTTTTTKVMKSLTRTRSLANI